MTDGVARELEQAEARLGEVWVSVDDEFVLVGGRRGPEHDVIVTKLVDAAIEVGRLRALAEHAPLIEAVRSLSESPMYAADFWEADEFGPLRGWAIAAAAAIAAREEARP